MKFWENDLNKILSFLLVVLVSFLLFVGCGAYQLRPKNTSWQENSEKQQSENAITQVDTNRCRQISQLRLENVQLKKQLESMKNKIEDEKKAVDDLKGEIAFWFSFGSILVTAITMIVAIIAVVVPLYNMSEIKNKQKKVEGEMESVKKSYNDMMEEVKRVRQEAYDIEPKEKFIQAMNKGKTDDIIKDLDDIITFYPKYSEIWAVYGNRAAMRFTNEDYVNALVDYTEAISKKNDVDYLYSGRADCYHKLAENEQDQEKKAKYEAKANEYEERAKELKQKGKA